MAIDFVSKLLGAGQVSAPKVTGALHKPVAKTYATNPNLISRLDAYDIQYGCPKEVKSDILGQKYCGLA